MNDKRGKVPSPPHPDRRDEPLPSQSPKSPVEDPDAPARIAAILTSAGYRLAEQDVEFLGSDARTAVRGPPARGHRHYQRGADGKTSSV
jgi:hypothetical protein